VYSVAALLEGGEFFIRIKGENASQKHSVAE
jgi:hypothetical protein